MKTTPKSLRLHIGIFGRVNVGKSSVLNLIAGQDVAITSPVAGTTTDVVEKTMELLPVGPVVFLDTAGLDDTSVLAEQRIGRTKKAFASSDIAVLVCEPNQWGEHETLVASEAAAGKTPLIVVVNKTDLAAPSAEFLKQIAEVTPRSVLLSAVDPAKRDLYLSELKAHILAIAPDDYFAPPSLIGDLVPAGGTAVLIVPIDLEAPKGRLILPQVQTIRDALDNDAAAIVVKEREYRHVLDNLKNPPDIVICDSQVVQKMVADTPKEIKCTTFSILFSRSRGDLAAAAAGACAVKKLKDGDKVLIAEACSHHALEDDIGRVKIPRWVRQYTGKNIIFDVSSGSDYPSNLGEYKLVIHCGGCMINRRSMLSRLEQAKAAGVPVTNYGVCISFVQGVLERALSPFPAALDAYQRSMK